MQRYRCLLSVALLAVAGCDPAPSRQVFLDWDINSCVGLPGGPSNERFASGKLGARSPEEIEILQDAERLVCQRYRRIDALYVEGARGGEGEKHAAAGYALSCAQARLAWAKADANETVARLEQAVKFADLYLETISAAFEADTVGHDQLIDASEAQWRSKIALLRVRSALKQLGVETNRLPRQIDPDNWREDDCGH